MQLNLPEFYIEQRIGEDGRRYVYDALRHKWLVCTPEEWVRQNFVCYMCAVLGYPPALMANERSLIFNSMRRRCDTVVFDHFLRPLVIVEYKRPTIDLTASVFNQIARYNSVLQARILIVSNGLKHYCCEYQANGEYRFLQAIPRFNELTS